MSELLNVATVAAILRVSPDTVIRRFGKMKGVVNLGTEETRNKRPYKQLRIPKHILEKYIGHPVDVPVQSTATAKAKPKIKSRDPLFVMEASQRMAQSVLENARKDEIKATLDTIAFNAKILTMVPEEQWGEIEHIGRDDEYDDQ